VTGAGDPPQRLVLLDANALLSAVRLRIDLARELAAVAPGWKAVVPASVLAELSNLAQTRHAAGAREFAKRFPTLPNEGSGDRAILAASTQAPGRAVLTNDRKLREALRGAGVTVLYIRGRRKVEVDGPL
jgi:rRNA-processing protein FCF1